MAFVSSILQIKECLTADRLRKTGCYTPQLLLPPTLNTGFTSTWIKHSSNHSNLVYSKCYRIIELLIYKILLLLYSYWSYTQGKMYTFKVYSLMDFKINIHTQQPSIHIQMKNMSCCPGCGLVPPTAAPSKLTIIRTRIITE